MERNERRRQGIGEKREPNLGSRSIEIEKEHKRDREARRTGGGEGRERLQLDGESTAELQARSRASHNELTPHGQKAHSTSAQLLACARVRDAVGCTLESASENTGRRLQNRRCEPKMDSATTRRRGRAASRNRTRRGKQPAADGARRPRVGVKMSHVNGAAKRVFGVNANLSKASPSTCRQIISKIEGFSEYMQKSTDAFPIHRE
eukprot:757237-Pleurochrysis_carterae.AAC.2